MGLKPESDEGKLFADGVIEVVYHMLAGQKGYENLSSDPDSIRAKIRVVVRSEVDFFTRKPRDGRIPGQTFGSLIPSAIDTQVQLAMSLGTQWELEIQYCPLCGTVEQSAAGLLGLEPASATATLECSVSSKSLPHWLVPHS